MRSPGHQALRYVLLGMHIFLSSLLSDTLKPCYLLNMRDQVLHSCIITGKFIDISILVFVF